jgi:hypothetical protein
VVKNGETGFWASSEEQWFSLLEKLILDKDLRIKVGKQSQQFIRKNYSVEATLPLFMNLFNKK